jgi:cytochrome c556
MAIGDRMHNPCGVPLVLQGESNVPRTTRILLASVSSLLLAVGCAQHAHDPARHGNAAGHVAVDTRISVAFPAPMKAATLAHMRDHLAALQEVQQALAAARFDEAAAIAEKRLGMSSMPDHGAHEVARYMPAGMREAGTQMHRSASRFAVAATESAVSQDVKPALAALAQVTATCVACHAAYRLE